MRTNLVLVGLLAASQAACTASRVPFQTDTAYDGRVPPTFSFKEAIALPEGLQDPLTKEIAAQLAASSVPTVSTAFDLARRTLGNPIPSLDGRDMARVTGLFRIGVEMPSFASKGDLVWELRVPDGYFEISRVLWVSTTTKAVKEIFPGPPS